MKLKWSTTCTLPAVKVSRVREGGAAQEQTPRTEARTVLSQRRTCYPPPQESRIPAHLSARRLTFTHSLTGHSREKPPSYECGRTPRREVLTILEDGILREFWSRGGEDEVVVKTSCTSSKSVKGSSLRLSCVFFSTIYLMIY